DQAEIDFENEGGETYICGNPPYLGSTWQSKEQKADIRRIFEGRTKTWGALDYVAGWFMKAADYGMQTDSIAAFVATNSICQGQQVPFLWPLLFATGNRIAFAHTSFKWANLASHNAGVTVVIVGITRRPLSQRRLFQETSDGETVTRNVANINAYLVSGPDVIVSKAMSPLTQVSVMDFGNKADDGGHLTLRSHELEQMALDRPARNRLVRRFFGSKEFINGETRFCVWVADEDLALAQSTESVNERIERVRTSRLSSKDAYARRMATRPHQFKTPRLATRTVIITPRVSSENRPYLPVGYLTNDAVIGDRNFALYDAPLWNMALIASRIHWVWIGTVCVRMRTDFSYSNTLGWNTFPVPALTEKNKADLTRCAEDILLAREAHFPATIADLYDPETMPANLRESHERNDETLERIYIGRRFKNDTERLEKLFELYTQMTSRQPATSKAPAGKTQSSEA
ncbi:MAG: type IIL restriction-modification enzyme MmeI, partial [Chthoniobacteraceae bacterium]